MKGTCDRDAFAKKIREAKRMPVAPQMRPLRNHVLRLAISSAKHGYCQRAGKEIAEAKRIAEHSPDQRTYAQNVKRSHAAHANRRRRRAR